MLLDTSAALALINPGHSGHRAVADRTQGYRLGLAGHAQFETYSVLTRLPTPHRFSAGGARSLIADNFRANASLDAEAWQHALGTLVRAGVVGGAVYDGLVALAAAADGRLLLSRDRRAAPTYQALGVAYELLT